MIDHTEPIGISTRNGIDPPLDVAHVEQITDVALEVGLVVVPQPLLRFEALVVDSRVPACEQRFEEMRRTLLRSRGRNPTRSEGFGDILDRPADQFRSTERQQARHGAAAGERLANTMQEQEVLRAGKDELARPVCPIDDAMDVREQVGGPLDLVEDHLASELIEEAARILRSEPAHVGVFERRVAMPRKGGANERGFARLPWSRYGHDRGIPGRGLQGP